MKKNKKWMGLVSTVMSAAILLGACGSSSSSGPTVNQVTKAQIAAPMSEWGGALKQYIKNINSLDKSSTTLQIQGASYPFLFTDLLVQNIIAKEIWPVSIKPYIARIGAALYSISLDVRKLPTVPNDPAASGDILSKIKNQISIINSMQHKIEKTLSTSK